MLRDQELLEMERPVSARHAPMRRCDRAAQFAPFAARSGFDETVQEAGRLTQAQIELAENEREALNDALVRLAARLPEQPEVRLTYFQPDAKKSGGTYRTILTRVRRLDANAQVLVLTDGTRIPFDALLSICGNRKAYNRFCPT